MGLSANYPSINGLSFLLLLLETDKTHASIPQVAASRQAFVNLLAGIVRALLAGHLDHKATALDRVDEDVARFKVRVGAPAAEEQDHAAALDVIVFRVVVEPAHLADGRAGGVRGDGGQVKDAQASGIVGLVGKAVDDVLVVVNRLGPGLVVASLLGVLEVADIPDAKRAVRKSY
jgi:hypothetical protein